MTIISKDFVLNGECTYTMHMISLKDFKASTIFKNIENKLKYNEKITDEDIASLQVIVYTNFEESQYEVLFKARLLIEEISQKNNLDINEKKAILYLFDVLSANMLDEDELTKYEEETYMLLNPTDRFLLKKGREEGLNDGREKAQKDIAKKLLDKGFSIDEVIELTNLSKNDILKIIS